MFSKVINYFEDFEQKYKFRINFIGLISIYLIYWLIHQVKLNLDLNLPEIINIPNFIGNVDSTVLALVGGFIVGSLLTRTTKLNRSNIFKLSILAGTLIGLVQNILIETKFGMNLLNQPNVSDPLDILWGTIFCLIACFVSFKVEKV
ncbi:MAG: hypothetical protein H6799_03090 [Candidatus Nomurabacteria bacterium]|nr:MAG: hypothetical protein H6799_03090 [Candidatus Nomurabacteria bacterium]HRV76156.1 hypothetical protein [Candidatus Saccharimonadales bacterium]